jgi:ABC-type transport system involved in multi-copper enzyme maturation permease subunit
MKLSPQWQLWSNQLRAVVSLELRRNLLTKRSLWMFLIAFAPVAIIFLHSMDSRPPDGFSRGGGVAHLEGDTMILAGIFHYFYLRLGIFFGCMGVFTWLFRGEVMHKSLHYYFLAPMRREVLVMGKFFAGLLITSATFATAVLLCFTLMYGHLGVRGQEYVFNGPGAHQLYAYLGVTVLACIGYGALFLFFSLLVKNPMIPGAIVLGWEAISGIFPSFMQKFSVTYYLKMLSPVDVPVRGFLALFTVVADPISPWLAVPGLLCLASAVLVFACFKIRTMEINYGAE